MTNDSAHKPRRRGPIGGLRQIFGFDRDLPDPAPEPDRTSGAGRAPDERPDSAESGDALESQTVTCNIPEGTLLSNDGQGATAMRPVGADLNDRFQERGEIARGGMGEVHRAFDQLLHRSVAMKLIRPESNRRRDLVHRFIEEAQIMGQLDHPNIVPVYDLGDRDGRLFFAMKLVNGRTLAEFFQELHGKPLTGDVIENALSVIGKVCDAVSFAHSRGVIHHDLKPQNIMVGSHGQVYVMDWGVAGLMEGARTPLWPEDVGPPSSHDGHAERRIVGTAAYMAPEQARGEVARPEPSLDVYGLGGILYELLTGCAPHSADSSTLAFAKAKLGRVAAPTERAIWPTLPPGLVRITMKALADDPGQRYASVDELSGELREFLRGGGWFHQRTFEKDELMVTEGDASDNCYIIVEGRAEVFKTIDGRREVLRQLGPGDVFGETAVLTDKARTASVRALDQVVTTVVDGSSLQRELDKNRWLKAFVQTLAERFREADSELTALRNRGH